MKKPVIYMIVLVSFMVSSVASAGSWHNSDIKRIYPIADGAFIVTFKTDHADCKSGSSPKTFYVKVGESGVTQEAQDKMYSLVLAAAMSGKKVQVNFETVSSSCFVNRMLVEF